MTPFRSLVRPLTAALLLGGLAAGASAAQLIVTVTADTTYCASVGTQCGGGDNTFAAASDANSNPVRLLINVSSAATGLAVTGLPISAFTFSNNLTPAGGSSAVVCTQAICGTSRFQGGTGGTYALFVERGSAGNWKAGTYAGSVRVANGADNGTGLMTFSIPDATP
jgi:hypothetical protein